jgi:hypothetical protein
MDTKGAVIDGRTAEEQFVSAGERTATAAPQPASRDTRDVLRIQ